MKRLWTCLLALLLIGAMLVGAFAEAELPEGEQEILAEAVEEVVAEDAEYTLGEGEEVEYAVEAEPTFTMENTDKYEFVVNDKGELTEWRSYYHDDENDIYYANNTGIVMIPAAVDGKAITAIGKGAFAGSDVMSVTIPASVTRIDEYAFADCSQLTAIVIPDSVTEIGEGAFSYCDNLRSATLPAGLTKIPDSLFAGTALEMIQIPAGVTEIGEYAFAWTDLSAVALPAGLKSIKRGAFNGCDNLTAIELPAGLTDIGAYSETRLLRDEDGKEIMVDAVDENGVTYKTQATQEIPKHDAVFYGTRIASLTIPASLTAIPDHAFEGMSYVTSLTIPAGVTSIGRKSFYDLDKLESVTLPATLTTLGAGAFGSCDKLKEFTIPDSVTSAGVYTKEKWERNDTTKKWSYVTHTYYDSVVYGSRLETVYVGSGLKTIKSALLYGARTVYVINSLDTVIDGYYTYTYDDDDTYIDDDYTTSAIVKAPCNSKAIQWCEAHDQNCIPLHNEIVDAAVPATFEKTGLTEGKHCNICNKVLTAQQVLPVNDEVHLTDSRSITIKKGTVLKVVVDDQEIKSLKSSNKKIVKVSSSAQSLTAKKKGSAKITITLKDKTKLTLKVKVTK